MAEIAANSRKVYERIEKAARKAKRNPQEIKLVAVTKNVSPLKIRKALKVGLAEIGENRVQELLEKRESLGELAKQVKWHFVGHLQRNKVKYIIEFIELIQSVDSLRLVEEIEKQARKINKIQPVLVEVNVSKEATKFGILPKEVEEFLKKLSSFENLKVLGLMTLAPLVSPEKTRPVFRGLKRLFDEIKGKNLKNIEMKYLSMGMSNDFEVAIEEGSNMVRIGTALFKSVESEKFRLRSILRSRASAEDGQGFGGQGKV